MKKADLEILKAKVEELIAVPYCCSELKDAGKAWLESIGSDDEKIEAEVLVKELEEDVLSIDELIDFAKTEIAVQKFGKEGADNMLSGALAAKENGGKYCTCEACQAGGFILDMKDKLLK